MGFERFGSGNRQGSSFKVLQKPFYAWTFGVQHVFTANVCRKHYTALPPYRLNTADITAPLKAEGNPSVQWVFVQ